MKSRYFIGREGLRAHDIDDGDAGSGAACQETVPGRTDNSNTNRQQATGIRCRNCLLPVGIAVCVVCSAEFYSFRASAYSPGVLTFLKARAGSTPCSSMTASVIFTSVEASKSAPIDRLPAAIAAATRPRIERA